jgi:hypothetical protein
LINAGAEVTFRDEKEATPLLIAAEHRSYEVADLLLNHSAELEASYRDGRNIVDIAVERNDIDLVSILTQHFPRFNSTQLQDPLAVDRAIRQDDLEAASALLKAGYSSFLRTMTTKDSTDDEYLSFLSSKAVEFEKARDTPHSTEDVDSFEPSLTFASASLLKCLTCHGTCIKAEDALPRLPTRVIDLGDPVKSEPLRLLEVPHLRARYVALSHRWDNTLLQVRTTKDNLQSRLKSIELGSLTRLVGDASTIVRQLGVRYLWIDAFCIIQDSHSDWSTEAANMANIYRNAFFTIAAGTSVSHSDTIFSKRYSNDSIPSANLVLRKRGWILQEEVLSRRILQYSSQRVDWECVYLNTDDSKYNSASDRQDNFRLRRALYGFRSTSMDIQKQAHSSWQRIIECYSVKELTNQTDRLVAILGIAQYMENIIQTQFLCGLWRQYLWRDLLWSVSTKYSSHIEGTSFPSWSCISVSGPVHYEWPPSSSPAFAVSAVEIISATVDSSLSITNLSGTLQLRGFFRRVYIREEPDKLYHNTASSSSPPRDVSKEEDTNSLRLQHDVSQDLKGRAVQDWWDYFDQDTKTDVYDELWLIPIAEEHYWYHCLVLAPTEKLEVYKRVGICRFDRVRSPNFFGPEWPQTVTVV